MILLLLRGCLQSFFSLIRLLNTNCSLLCIWLKQYIRYLRKLLKSGATLVVADLHGDRESSSFQDSLSAWKSFYFNRLGNISVEDEKKFENAINSIYFIPETRILSLLQAAGFRDITKFYNAFLFGGWNAKLR